MRHIITVGRYPAGRYVTDGPVSGERYRNAVVAGLELGHHVTLSFRECVGVPTTFLEELFGGLVRLGYPIARIEDRLSVEATLGTVRLINRIMNDAVTEKERSER